MTASFERQTATILQFPVGGRAGRRERISDRSPLLPTSIGGPSFALSDLAFGGSWYHEEALHDGEIKPDRSN